MKRSGGRWWPMRLVAKLFYGIRIPGYPAAHLDERELSDRFLKCPVTHSVLS
jgi:hypothetical protein